MSYLLQAFAAIAAVAGLPPAVPAAEAELLAAGERLVRAWANQLAHEFRMDGGDDRPTRSAKVIAYAFAMEAAATAAGDIVRLAPSATPAGIGVKATAACWAVGLEREASQDETSARAGLCFEVLAGVAQAGGPAALRGAVTRYQRRLDEADQAWVAAVQNGQDAAADHLRANYDAIQDSLAVLQSMAPR